VVRDLGLALVSGSAVEHELADGRAAGSVAVRFILDPRLEAKLTVLDRTAEELEQIAHDARPR